MTDRYSSNVEAAAYLARECDVGPDPDGPLRAELAAEAHADRDVGLSAVERLAWRAEKLRQRDEAPVWTPGLGPDEGAGW